MKNILCSKCKKRPAVIFISKMEGDKSTPEGLCLKCAMDMNIGPIKQMMDSMGITEEDIDAVSEQINTMMEENDGFEPGGASTFPLMQGLFNSNDIDTSMLENDKEASQETEEAENVTEKSGKSRKKDKKKPKRKYLEAYCTDLTKKAREGKIDAIIGRENEIYRVIQILSRRTKNNPCLIGEPGVGKTAIAEGLALKVAAGAVPAKLAQRVKSDTRWALVTLMESKGNRCSMKEMKEELVPSVLSAKEWEAFKQDARRILQEDPYFSAVVDETDTYTLRTSPITQEEKQLTVFNAEKDFYSRVKIIKDFVSKDLDVESEAFSDMVKFFNSQLARFSENVTDRVLASFLLLDQLRNQQHIPTAVITTQVSFSDLYKKIDDKISVFDAINNADLKRSYLENVMACDKSWPELYKKCFPYYTYSWIPNSLKNNGKESIYLDILKDSVHSYRENVDVFLWNYKNASAHEWQKAGISNEDLIITLLLVLDYTASSIDLKKDVSENRKRNDLVINYLFKEKQIFKAIEDGERDLASKIYSIIANDKNIDRGYVIEVRHLISQKYPDFTFFDDQPVTIDEDSLIPMGFLCTKKALEEKIKEKEHIEHVELQEVASEIADARALGDLRENAEYQYGKDKQKNLNARLRTLTDEIEKAQVITPDSVSDSKVSFGTTVVLHDRLQNKDVSYTILGQWESDPDNGILNFKTPLGMKLLNRTVGDELDFSINGNPYSYKVVSISVADF